MTPQVSIVVPAFNEGLSIVAVLNRIGESVQVSFEILVVYDQEDDSTACVVATSSVNDERMRGLVNRYGQGPANAIRFGIDSAQADIIVVTMADGSDDPRQIDDLVRLVERGVVVAAASRYAPGGQQIGGRALKRLLSRIAGLTLYYFGRVGTRDATNSFKAYSKKFIEDVGIDSREGFALGLEMTAKARRLREPVAEIPTIWLERQEGLSNFKIAAWIPVYLKWYLFAFGPKLSRERLRARLGEN